MAQPHGPLHPFPTEAIPKPGRTDEKRDADADREEDENGRFFETFSRVPSRVSFCVDLPTSSSSADDDDGEEDDVRISFASAIAPPSEFHRLSFARGSPRSSFGEDKFEGGGVDGRDQYGSSYDYDVWLGDPASILERRRRLFQGMGLGSNKDLAADFRTLSSRKDMSLAANAAVAADTQPAAEWLPVQASSMMPSSLPQRPLFARSRSRSDAQLDGRRGSSSPGPSFSRSSSAPSAFWGHNVRQRPAEDGEGGGGDEGAAVLADICRIKNLVDGKEFVISEVGKDGTSNQLNDLQTGLRFTMEEFEQFLGYSPIVKEVMRRANLIGGEGQAINEKISKSLRSKSLKSRSRKKKGWLKNIKLVSGPVNWLIHEKERMDAVLKGNGKSSSDSSSELLKVRNHGKSYKELTGLYMSQDIHAHQGSIWTLKFSSDAQYLASAGEDRVIHVWKVQECNAFSTPLLRQELRVQSSRQAMANGSPDQSSLLGTLPTPPLKMTKRGKSSKKSLPDYISMPEVIFSLSEKPVCTFEGHLEDVLDLSWSRSQYLLSSSMDKTVRLWDMETKACLKLFAHNDYVTCIQFNPIDDRYFISGSLDAKLRMWSIPDRQVVDWSDLNEMVTAVCYTPDGQSALVGSHRGTCRFYKTSDYKLSQESQVAIRRKKKKSHPKKITGFQFSPSNQSEMLVTSADSQVRVFDGVNLIHKFKGFRNTSSQICASYTSDGKYVVCASEDSYVYIWKREQTRSTPLSKGKGWSTSRSYEHFYCKDVSVAIPWPNVGSNHEPISLPSPSRRYGHQDGLPSSDSHRSSATLYDIFHSSRSYRPLQLPLPKKSYSVHVQANENLRSLSRARSSVGNESFASGSASHRSIFDSGTFSSLTSSWRWYSGSSRKQSSTEVSAWGLVVVTADLSGHIRIYQNFGLPVRLSRQTNLF